MSKQVAVIETTNNGKPVTLQIETHEDRYRASNADNRGEWEVGKTPESAVSRWKETHK